MKRTLSLILLTVLAFATIISMVTVTKATTIVTVAIDPAVVPGKVGKNFTFDITVSGIDASVLDLFAFELKLNWTDLDFNYVGAVEGPFLQSSGPTFWVTPSRVTSGTQEVLTLSCTRTGGGFGSLGSGVLASITLYVVGGTTGSVFDLWAVKLRNSALDPIEPPKYDVNVVVQDGTFSRPRSYDLKPTYGEVDIYDLSTVGVNYGTNIIRITKIPTQWAVGTWTTPGFVGASDNNNAFATAQNAQQAWTNFQFNTTSWTAVSKVELGLERRASAARSIQINMSNNNGASWSATGYTHAIAETYDTMVWIDVSTAFAWTKGDVNNIAVRLTVLGTGTIPVYVDYLAIRVTPSPVKVPPEAFNPEADVNNDLVVNIDDLVMVAAHYGTYEL